MLSPADLNMEREIRSWTNAVIEITEVHYEGLPSRRIIEKHFDRQGLLFLQGGGASVCVNDTVFELHGSIFFRITAGDAVRIETDENRTELFLVLCRCLYDPLAGRNTFLAKDTGNTRSMLIKGAEKVSKIRELYSKMLKIWGERDALKEVRLLQLFYALLDVYYSLILDDGGLPAEKDVFETTRKWLEEHCTEDIRIKDLGSLTGSSETKIYDLFQKKTGISPVQYLIRLRLDRACLLLANTNMTIEDISSACGFNEKGYFSRLFLQKQGTTPGRWRKNSRTLTGIRNPASAIRMEAAVISNMGIVTRYETVPGKIVCLDYAAAEMCASLGLAGQITGIASADTDIHDCREPYRTQLASVPFIHGRSRFLNVPSMETVLMYHPEIVIGTGFSFRRFGGVADPEDFEREGIRIYALNATCRLGSTYEDIYQDLENLGKIFCVEETASALIKTIREREKELGAYRLQLKKPVRVFVFDAVIDDEHVLTCGRSLESYMIETAGGLNIFKDAEKQFVTVSWKDAAAGKPDVILIHDYSSSPEDGAQKAAYLRRVTEMADTPAIRNNMIFRIGIKKIFPSIDCIETAFEMAEWFHD